MVQKIHPWGVIGVPNSGPYVKRFQIRELLSKCSILEPSLTKFKETEFTNIQNGVHIGGKNSQNPAVTTVKALFNIVKFYNSEQCFDSS